MNAFFEDVNTGGDAYTTQESQMEGQDLSSFLKHSGKSVTPVHCMVGLNMVTYTGIACLRMDEFAELSYVPRESQRPLNMPHAIALAGYLLRGLVRTLKFSVESSNRQVPAALEEIAETLGSKSYFALAPIVVNISQIGFGGVGAGSDFWEPWADRDGIVRGITLKLNREQQMRVIDGQHRREAMSIIVKYLEDLIQTGHFPKKPGLYPAKGEKATEAELEVFSQLYDHARTANTVAVEIHLGLSPDQERQLFHDLNNYGKKVEQSLSWSFDQSNPVNLWIQEHLEGKLVRAGEKDQRDWDTDDGSLSHKELAAINAILFLNKTNLKSALPADVAKVGPTALDFWVIVSKLPNFGSDLAKTKTVAAQPVVLKALAKLTYDFAFGREKSSENLRKLFNGIKTFDFSHGNRIWQYYQDAAVRSDPVYRDLATYLPREDGGNRDIGQFSNGVMRFGSKHNDIAPIIGDMIRWSLRLPPRGGDIT